MTAQPADPTRGEELMAELQQLRAWRASRRNERKASDLAARRRYAPVAASVRAEAERILASLPGVVVPVDPRAAEHLRELEEASRPGSAEYARWRATLADDSFRAQNESSDESSVSIG